MERDQDPDLHLDDQETLEQAPDSSGDEQVPTGLGSGAVSGLGHSQTHEPESLLDAGTGTEEEDR